MTIEVCYDADKWGVADEILAARLNSLFNDSVASGASGDDVKEAMLAEMRVIGVESVSVLYALLHRVNMIVKGHKNWDPARIKVLP